MYRNLANKRKPFRIHSSLALGCWLALGASLFLASTVWGIQTESVRTEFTGTTMGPIRYRVVLPVELGKPEYQSVGNAVQETLDRVNQLMSTYLPDSDVSRFNRAATTDWVTVDRETAQVIQRALEISDLCNGAFDITVGPAVELWNFGPNKKHEFQPPTDDQVQSALDRIGYQRLQVRMDPPALKKAAAHLQVDLSAIAKGYAVDQVARTLFDSGYDQFMVEVGGEVYAHGRSPSGRNWRIGVEAPAERQIQIHRVVEIDGCAVATSGDYRNFTVHQGQRYSHTIDPQTGRPVTHHLAIASVVAPDCMTADAVATAVMVLGAEKGNDFCQANSFEVLTVSRDPQAPLDMERLITTVSAGYPAVERVPAKPKSGKKGEENRSAGVLTVFLAAAAVFLLAVLGMAVGAIFNNKPVQGSCGGLASMPAENGELACSLCSKPTSECVEKQSAQSPSNG